MPNIIQYNSTSDINPSDKGIQAADNAARVYAQTGRQLAGEVKEVADVVEQHMAVMETSELYKTGTEFELNLQTRYEKESALPENRNDPHFGDRFMAEIGPQLDEWGNGAGTERGKQLAATLKANIRNKIFNHVAAGQSEMDAAHVQDNLTQTLNTLGAGLALDPSEANLNRTIGTAQVAIQGMTMAIPDVASREQVASRMIAQYVPALVLRRYNMVGESIKNQVAETGGDTSPALEQLNMDIAAQLGFQYLSPEAQTRVSTLGTEAVRQGKELFRAKVVDGQRQEDSAVQSAILEAEVAIFRPNGAGGVAVAPTPALLDAVQRIAKMPGAERSRAAIEGLANALHAATQDQITNKETITDQSVYLDLSGRIGSTGRPLRKVEVDQARAAGKLSDSDYSFLRTAAIDSDTADPKSNHALAALHRWIGQVKPMIDKSDPLGLNVDAVGAEEFSKFSWGAEEAFRKAIAAGYDPDEAVRSLTDPKNPRGLYRSIPSYQKTGKQSLQIIQEAAGNLSGNIPLPPSSIARVPTAPVKDGESTEAYLKRIGQ